MAATAPAHADAPPRARIPVGSWILTRQPDGHVAVVTGTEAIEIATRAAEGTPGPAVLSMETDQPVHALDVVGTENDPLRGQQWALDKDRCSRARTT